MYLGVKPINKLPNAFDALLAYELNCKRYEWGVPEHLHYTVKIPKGEEMRDFALKYDTTVEAMKKEWRNVENHLKNK